MTRRLCGMPPGRSPKKRRMKRSMFGGISSLLPSPSPSKSVVRGSSTLTLTLTTAGRTRSTTSAKEYWFAGRSVLIWAKAGVDRWGKIWPAASPESARPKTLASKRERRRLNKPRAVGAATLLGDIPVSVFLIRGDIYGTGRYSALAEKLHFFNVGAAEKPLQSPFFLGRKRTCGNPAATAEGEKKGNSSDHKPESRQCPENQGVLAYTRLQQHEFAIAGDQEFANIVVALADLKPLPQQQAQIAGERRIR